MPKVKRQRIAHTEEWSILQQRTLWPEQQQYELIRPIVLLAILLQNVLSRREPQSEPSIVG